MRTPTLVPLSLLFLPGPTLFAGVANPDFEEHRAWLVRGDPGEGGDPAAPAYVDTFGVDATRGMRLGRALELPNPRPDGASRSALGQGFECPGAEEGYCTISFHAMFFPRDGEEARVLVGSRFDPHRLPNARIPASSRFQKYRLSVRGCGYTSWVEFTLEEADAGPRDPQPEPDFQSTLLIDEVTCECTPGDVTNSGEGVSELDDLRLLVLFGAEGSPPVAGQSGWYLPEEEPEPPPPRFLRGDSDATAARNLSDAVYTLNWRFRGGPAPQCEKTADANDDGLINLADPVFLLNGLFRGGPQPPPPSSECGADPTEDALGCERYAPCG